MKTLYKVVNFFDRSSIFAQGKYQTFFEKGLTLEALNFTVGYFCFGDFSSAKSWVDAFFRKNLRIIEVEVDEKDIQMYSCKDIPNPNSEDCELIFDFFYDLIDDSGEDIVDNLNDDIVRYVPTPYNTVFVKKLKVVS